MVDKGSINVSQFLRQYESQSTRKNYLSGFRQFFELIYPELTQEFEQKQKELEEEAGKTIRYIPSEIVLEFIDTYSSRYLAEDRDHREDVMDFKDSLKNYAPKTVGARLNSIRVFLDENGINFPKRFFKNLNGKVTEAISEERVPSNEELRRIIEYLPVQGKALSLVLSSSGMRIGEVLKIKLSDVELNRELAKIKIRAEYTKTGKKRITFISPEAKLAVEEWLSYRDQYVERANRRSWEHKREDSDELFPFTSVNFYQMWRNALRKAKLLERDEKTNRTTMRPHNLRKYFRLRVGRYGRDEAECLMGHQAGLNRIYANFDDAEERLEEVYKKSIPELSIYGRTSVITDESFKKEIKKNEDTINTLIRDGYVKDKKIEYLSNEVEELKKKTKEIDQLKRKMKKKTEEDEETKRRIANIEQDHQSLKMLMPVLEEVINSTELTWKFQDITSKNRKVTTED